MRLRGLIIAAAIAVTGSVAVEVPVGHAAGLPPCGYIADKNQVQCIRSATPGEKGPITVIGDSVLVGSGKFVSSVASLPELLTAGGWGPVVFQASVGMRIPSATTQIRTWRNQGWDAPVVAVNLGANDFAFCPDNPSRIACYVNAITGMVDAIGPSKLVWWGKITTFLAKDMNAWNAALDAVAFTRPNLVVWDWPGAAAAADPPFEFDAFNTHLRSPAAYERRSALMVDSITTLTHAARFAGPVATVPSAASGPLGFVPETNARLLDTIIGASRLEANSTRVVDASAFAPAGAEAVVLTLGSYLAGKPGYLTAYPCDEDRPGDVSHLNVDPRGNRASQAIVRLSAAKTICIYAFADTELTVDVQGWMVSSGGLRFTPQTPDRVLDSRNTGMQPVYTIQAPVGADAVAVNLIGLDSPTSGELRVWDCSDPAPPAYHLFYGPNEIVAGAAYVPVSAAGTFCVATRAGAHAVVDITGVFRTDGQLRFTAATVTRLLDTRSGTGGWIGRHGKGQTLDLVPAPTGAQAVTGTITMVGPAIASFISANPCGVAPGTTSAGNAAAGTDTANSTTVQLAGDGRLCLYSSQNEHTLFDVAGWWVP